MADDTVFVPGFGDIPIVVDDRVPPGTFYLGAVGFEPCVIDVTPGSDDTVIIDYKQTVHLTLTRPRGLTRALTEEHDDG